ncbi:MAG: type II toxin-antitoxin system RelB/DinJ family antitoxin [Pyramidobacter sp.]
MSQTSINIRMDEELKNDFNDLTEQLGLSMSAAFNIFAKTAVREQRIPFPLALPRLNAKTLAAMEEAERIADDPNEPCYNSVDELFESKGWK